MSYSRNSGPFDSVNEYLRRSQMPGTLTVIAISALLFLISCVYGSVAQLFVFQTPPLVLLDLWTMFAYPLMNVEFISCVLGLWIFGWVAGSLERAWGTVKLIVFFFGLAAITALSLFVGGTLLHHDVLLIGIYFPLTSIFIAWATINPMQTVMVFVLPVQARYLALFYVGVIYFVLYGHSPILGLFALVGPLVAFLVVRFGLMTGSVFVAPNGPDLRIIKGGSRMRGRPLDDAGITYSLNPLDRFKAWQQRRRLEKLLSNRDFPNKDDESGRR